jgi:hypothetical protein
MLQLEGESFTTGRATFLDQPQEDVEATAKVYVRLQLGEVVHLAQLDTGAAYSVLSPEVAATIETDVLVDSINVLTNRGKRQGPLVRAVVTLVAETGDSLVVEATFFVPDDWPPGRLFIGYTGFVEFIRLGLDPQKQQLYFGPAA